MDLLKLENDSRNEAITQMLHASNALEPHYNFIDKKKERDKLSMVVEPIVKPSFSEPIVYRDYAGLSRFGEGTAQKTRPPHVADPRRAYRNRTLWSSNSVALEQLLASVAPSSDSAFNFDVLGRLCNTTEHHIGVMDSFVICSPVMGDDNQLIDRKGVSALFIQDESDDFRYGFHHICSEWSFAKEYFAEKMVCPITSSYHYHNIIILSYHYHNIIILSYRYHNIIISLPGVVRQDECRESGPFAHQRLPAQPDGFYSTTAEKGTSPSQGWTVTLEELYCWA
jgi:hypothetical protein